AAEKAAILKAGVPAAIGPQPGAALAVIERQASKIRAPLRVAGEHWSVHAEHGRLVYQDDDGLLDLPLPKRNGRHQHDNAGVARRVIAVPIPRQEKGLPAEALVGVARRIGSPAESRDSVEAALAAIGRLGLEPPPRILIAGSLYLAGEVLALNGTPPE